MADLGFDLPAELARLKDFQRNTVDYVFRRLYRDAEPTRRFLVADEVGLGKTLVARGLIAKVIEELWSTVDRIDVVYMCSNAAIAQQNLNKLNVLGRDGVAIATRLTMLPRQISRLAANRVNFVSFTPGTAFDLKSRGGLSSERVLLYQMLRDGLGLPRSGLLNLLQCTVSRDWWRESAAQAGDEQELEGVTARFQDALRAEGTLLERLRQACDEFHRYRENWPGPLNERRLAVVGDLRMELARLCVDDLEPDLVILDEFQRFRHLLDRDTEAGWLADRLLGHRDAKVLLLSATPYKMVTLDHEEEDHWTDFMATLKFLFDHDQERLQAAEGELRTYREALFRCGEHDGDRMAAAGEAVRRRLCAVMCRTERTGLGLSGNAMCSERTTVLAPEALDLRHAVATARVARALHTQDPTEYWKSAPYFLNFARRDYDLGRRLHEEEATADDRVRQPLRAAPLLLRRAAVELYHRIDPANARLRQVQADLLDDDLWKLLWLPPSLPYHELGGPFARCQGASKALVFSSWHAVPDAIAALCSFEAERRMLLGDADKPRYSELHRRRRGLLRFAMADGRLAGMPVMALVYPCRVLRDHLDPLALALRLGGEPVGLEQLRREARRVLAGLFAQAGIPGSASAGRTDERWYWLAPLLLDERLTDGRARWIAPAGDEDEPSHVLKAHTDVWDRGLELVADLGAPPADLVDVLADLGLAGPAICAARTFRRVAPDADPDSADFNTAVSAVAQRLRLMLNLPLAMGVVRQNEDPYWQQVLRYAAEGCLQAVLDEWAHGLMEQEGLSGYGAAHRVADLSRAMVDALSIRSATISAEEIRPSRGAVGLRFNRIRFRTRFAMRLSEGEDGDQRQVVRLETVRAAFNSPFHPFVLATTAIGQEGLDFHPYCHVVYHWNLPSNPVDLEQREGRVHRYKGLAVRRNLARKYGLACLPKPTGTSLPGDPWSLLFDRAAIDRLPGDSELVPFWVFEVEGGASVERRVPMLPFSREIGRLQWLKKSLAVYRLVFGQPRQSDLIDYLVAKYGADADKLADRWRVDLGPPQATDAANGEQTKPERGGVPPESLDRVSTVVEMGRDSASGSIEEP